MAVRVVIAEDEAFVRDALAMVLSAEDDIDVVGVAARGDEVRDLVGRERPDVALLDIDLPGASGLEVAEVLGREVPGCAVVVMTSHGRPGYLYRAVEAGARGFLTKDLPAARLAGIVRDIAAGGRYVDPQLAADAIAVGASPLTPREREVLRLSGEGRPLREIAARLSLSEGTVRNYLSASFTKLGVANKVAALRLATRAGWI